MKKIAFPLLMASSLFATEPSLEKRVETLEKRAKELRNVKPAVRQKNDFFVTGDFLFWRPSVDGLAYATSTNSSLVGSVQNLHFDWDKGFRVGIGYRMPYDFWEVQANWTHYITAAHGLTANGSNLLFPEWMGNVSPIVNPITDIDGHWYLHWNYIDGEFARFFRATKAIGLRPHFGLRGTFIEERFKSTLHGGQKTGINLAQDTVYYHGFFRGIGPRAGFDSEWGFLKNWSLYANGGTSLLFGDFQMVQQEYQATAAAPSVLSVVASVSDQPELIVPTLDLALGLRWDITTASNRVAIRWNFGWEFNEWFGLNKIKHILSSEAAVIPFIANNENLTAQGLVISARVDF